jgi:hypothetical protein
MRKILVAALNIKDNSRVLDHLWDLSGLLKYNVSDASTLCVCSLTELMLGHGCSGELLNALLNLMVEMTAGYCHIACRDRLVIRLSDKHLFPLPAKQTNHL